MTLFKQILLGAIAFVFITIILVGYEDYKKTNDFIQDQLSANAKHTATSLGLAISTQDVIDKNSVELMINTIFDSGYYKEIKFVNADNEVLYENHQEDNFYGVNDFFVKMVNIPTPTESFDIIKWNKIGTVYVQISPAFAYEQLYATCKDLFISLGLVFIISFIFIYFILKIILAPLNKVRKQAEAILEHQFIVQDKIPFTYEVKKMVLAMNSMVGKVKDIFDKESETLDKYNELLYKDEKTGLLNRRYFINKYNQLISSEQYSNGACFLLSIKETYNLKKFLGFQKSRELLEKIAKLLKKNNHIYDNECVFALNENDFIILGNNTNDFVSECKNILKSLEVLFSDYNLNPNDFKIKAALSSYEATPLNELLSKLDLLLIKNINNFSLNISNSNDIFVLGKEQYKDFILNAMKNNDFCFVSQDVLSTSKEVFHSELYLRLKIDNEIQTAAYFMPIVNEINLAKDLDFYVISKALKMNFSTNIAINITSDFIKEENYSALQDILKKNKDKKLFFELAMNKDLNIGNLLSFSRMIKHYNVVLGLDHFVLKKEYLNILNELHVAYIKIQANMLLDLLEDSNTSGAKNSLDIILNSKGIDIVAIGIEDEDTYNKIKALNINLVQGRYISKIK